MLNLDNMDCPQAWDEDCPLVLTSPRSLAACRLVGVKPVELLPRDIRELAETIRPTSLSKLADLCDLLEHRRLAKLEHCRAIRRYLISQHAIDERQLMAIHEFSLLPQRAPNNSFPEMHSPRNRSTGSFPRRQNDYFNRKEQLDLENTGRKFFLSTRSSSAQSCPREPPREPPPRLLHPTGSGCGSGSEQPLGRPVLVDCFGRVERCPENETCHPTRRTPRPQTRLSKCSETSFSDKVASSTDAPVSRPPPSPSPLNNRISQNRRKNLRETSNGESKGEDHSRLHFDETSSQSLLASERLSESSKTPRSSSKPVRTASHRLRRRSRPRSHSQQRRTRSLSATPVPTTQRLKSSPSPAPASTPSVLACNKCPSETGFRDQSSKCLSRQIWCPTREYCAYRNKIASLGTQWRRTAEAVGLSEEDQKILLLLEKKAIDKRMAEMKAEAARIVWEREQEQRAKQLEWEKEKRKQEIAERRKEDKAETNQRLFLLERNFNRAQRHLAETLRKRDQEAQQRLHKIAIQKATFRAEKKAADSARQAAVEKRLRHLNQELGRYQNFTTEELEARIAEGRREWFSSSAIERSQMTSASSLVLSYNPNQNVQRKRPSSAPGTSSTTADPRIASARMIRDAIERNLAASRVRCVIQSEAAVVAAASRARITATRRRSAHLASAARLRARRGVAVARLRTRIRAGERKIAALLAAKERAVANSRASAAVAAQLRHDLRGTLSPSTFDRMAANVQQVPVSLLRSGIPSSSSSRAFVDTGSSLT